MSRRWVIACVSLILMLSGCEQESKSHVIVFAGSSMTQALMELETEFEQDHHSIDLELLVAGSQTLAMQINEGTHADIFISANLEQMQRAEGFSGAQMLVENQLVAISAGPVGPTIPDAIDNAARILVAHRDVPAGRYTYDALVQLGVWESARAKIVSYEHSVQSVVTKMVMGQADLGFVYRTDAISVSEQMHTIEFPSGISTTTGTWIALHTNTTPGSAGSIAYRFITDSRDAKRIYSGLGFTMLGDAP